MKAGIKDVAKAAGVSIGTVSRVVNNKDRVNPETRKRVKEVIKQLNYRPSQAARSLVTKQTSNIMVLVPSIGEQFFADIISVISRACRNSGYQVVVGDLDYEPKNEVHYMEMLRDQAADGMIIAPLLTGENKHKFQEMIANKLPVVFLDRFIEGIDATNILVDNQHGGKIVVDYLASQGHSKIAFISGDATFQPIHSRFTGYKQGLEENNIPFIKNYCLLHEKMLEREPHEAAQLLMSLPEPPTAIFAENDYEAIVLMKALREMGKRIPEEVAVVGYDDIYINQFIDIPLTTMAQPIEEIGQTAVELLISKIENKD